MHSAEQARHIRIVVCVIDIMTCMSHPFMRSSMRVIVSQTSAQLAHIPAHLPMPSPASASAHMMHAEMSEHCRLCAMACDQAVMAMEKMMGSMSTAMPMA